MKHQMNDVLITQNVNSTTDLKSLYYVFQYSLVNEFGSVAPAEICTHSLIFRYAFSKLLRSK